ncbi:MAG: type II toxin-antitoxin system VapC family toxin [Candidatus Lokiarchaeota archaeon]|nr:type II toxin-antitoxin system VapC family toxin [Candidatus Lokiarchaeota archaeon]
MIPCIIQTRHLNRKIGKSSIECALSVTIFPAIEFPVALTFPKVLLVLPSAREYTKSFEYACKLRKRGTPIPAMDIVIAAIVVERDATLVSDDVHFALFNAAEPRLKRITLETFFPRTASPE